MASSPRPTPLLADLVLAPASKNDVKTPFSRANWPMLKQGVRAAQKFVFTYSAYERIRNALWATPEQIVHNAKFALPPHTATWLEVAGQDPLGSEPPNTAYLILDGVLYTFILNGKDDFAYSPLAVDLHTPPSREDQKLIMAQLGRDAEQIDRGFWGPFYDDISPKLRPRLRQQHRVRLLPQTPVATEHWAQVADLDFHVRIVLATLLALNQPNHPLVYTVNNAQRRMTAKGPRSFVEHNMVAITLGGSRKVNLRYRHRGGGPGDSPYHDVEDHWMHFRTTEGRTCTHGYGRAKDFWEPYGDGEKPRYRCTACGTRRVRRYYPHGWGDGSKGIRLHTHIVKTPDDD